MKRPYIEPLEPRRLFAEVTLLATGRLGGSTDWIATVANEIVAQNGGANNVPTFVLTVDTAPNSGNLVGSIQQSGGPTLQANTSGEIVVTINYLDISANASYGGNYIGQVIADYLMNDPVDGVTLASFPIHEISVSRGSAIMDGVSLTLGQAGVWVDQQTFLDPDPIAAQQDPPTTLYDNVEFGDDYWRNDQSTAQTNDGHPVAGAYDLNLWWLDSEDAGYSIAHLAPAGYYVGTMDSSATYGGDGPIYSEWYGDTLTMPARNATGWLYSSEVGGTRPLSGVWAASGGTGVRTPAGQVGSQWGNVSDLAVTSGTTIDENSSFSVSFIHQDRGSGDTIEFFLDSDRNPLNGNFTNSVGSVSYPVTAVTANGTTTLSTAGIAPGTYWVCAQVTNALGDVRYDYESVTQPITITGSKLPQAAVINPASVTTASKSPEILTVAYTSTALLNTSSLGNSNLAINGPGYSTSATFVGTSTNSGSFVITATYSVAAPASGWSASNNGTFVVSLNSSQVEDVNGNYASSGQIGTFNVDVVQGSLSGAVAPAASSYNLTTIGTSDWAHWGTGGNQFAFDDKATGGTQISNLVPLGLGQQGYWSDPSRNVTWNNGTPQATDSGDGNYLWANNAIGAGFQFTVPATTSSQTLYVYAGGYDSQGTLTAQLSDNSAPSYVATISGTGLYSNWFTITFVAGSANQLLTISYTKTANVNGNTGGSVDMIAAALVSSPVVDKTPPTAALSSAPSLTAASSSAYQFVVTYTDNVAVNASTLGNNNLLVTGPSSYSQVATLVSTGLASGPTITATYSVPAPGGGWSNSSDGNYTVALQANQVADTSGNYAAAGNLGTFSVNIPVPGAGSLSGTQVTAASSYNLTTLGTGDWAAWGAGNSATAFDHKASGNSQISNVTKLGTGAQYGSYFNTGRGVSWSDGTPLASDSEDDYIWANTAIGAGYSFTVPASTTTQTLYVYAGGYSSGGQLTAHLSDGSAADYVVAASGSGSYANFYTITFKAASAGQTLTISYVKTTNINGTGGSVDLIAAALAGPPAVDTTPPTAALSSAPSLTAASSSAYQFVVTYTDNVAVNASTLGNNNLLVTGPSSYSQVGTLVSTGLTSGPTITATYSVPAPAGGWSNSSDGNYTVALQANQVADTSGNYAAAGNLGTFSVNIPVPGAGSLSGTQVTAASSYNLTTLGTTDWIHWGTGNSFTAVDRNATGGSQISNVTELGTGADFGSWYDTSRDVTWTNGSPQTTGNDNAYIWANNAIGAGYSFTVPASTTAQTLYIYAGGFESGATLTAHLSDGSAPDYVVTTSGTGLYTNYYAITFKAASAGQALTISYVKSSNVNNAASGSVDLIAAALA